MLLELSVTQKKKGRHGSVPVTDLSKIISASGLFHQEKSKGTVLEGSWDQLMAVAKKCHDEALKNNETFVTMMRAVDGPDVAPCSKAPGDCGAIKDLLEDDGDWLIP
ncbi:MAG: thiamine-binding protein [Terracidiphilus sp.]